MSFGHVGQFSRYPGISRPERRQPPAHGALRPQSLQSVRRLVQRFVPLAECKPHLLRSVPRIAVEARSRNASDTDLLNQVFRERYVVGIPECADVRHDVISTTRSKATKASCFE